jgi:hypothetical protein
MIVFGCVARAYNPHRNQKEADMKWLINGKYHRSGVGLQALAGRDRDGKVKNPKALKPARDQGVKRTASGEARKTK